VPSARRLELGAGAAGQDSEFKIQENEVPGIRCHEPGAREVELGAGAFDFLFAQAIFITATKTMTLTARMPLDRLGINPLASPLTKGVLENDAH
jgi:hypothetical protein